MSETGAPKEPKVIKRYTNRKLYDTVESRYVTLDEIADMVKQGVDVKIIDNRTKDDLTSVTLAQIVFEEQKKKSPMPLSVLRDMIRGPQEQLSDFLKTEVGPRVASIRNEAEARLGGFLRREEAGDKASAEGSPPPLSPAEFLKTSTRALDEWQKRLDERVKVVVENVVGNLPALGRDLGSLVARIESLEKKIQALEEKRR